MNENATVEFVNKICEMDRAGQEPKIIEIDGIKYTDCRRLEKIDTHISPKYLTVHSLYGLTQIIREERSKYQYPLFVIVDSPNTVVVMTQLLEDYKRDFVYGCEARRIRHNDWGRFENIESFIINLRSKFVENEDLKYILSTLSKVSNTDSVQQNDDGVSQTVETRRGVSLATKTAIKPILKLAPYRTFTDVEQPESEFLFRLDTEGNAALFEADGGAWEQTAINNIADYLMAELSGVEGVTVIA